MKSATHSNLPNSHPSSTPSDELLKAQSLALSLLESSSDGIVVIDRSGIVELVNTKAQNILEVDVEQAIGKSIAEIFVAYNPVTKEKIDLADDRYRKPHLANTNAYIVPKEGQLRHISFELKPNRNPFKPELSGALVVIRDLRDSNNTEAQIRLIATCLLYTSPSPRD